jgi:hypothetical protein
MWFNSILVSQSGTITVMPTLQTVQRIVLFFVLYLIAGSAILYHIYPEFLLLIVYSGLFTSLAVTTLMLQVNVVVQDEDRYYATMTPLIFTLGMVSSSLLLAYRVELEAREREPHCLTDELIEDGELILI